MNTPATTSRAGATSLSRPRSLWMTGSWGWACAAPLWNRNLLRAVRDVSAKPRGVGVSPIADLFHVPYRAGRAGQPVRHATGLPTAAGPAGGGGGNSRTGYVGEYLIMRVV